MKGNPCCGSSLQQGTKFLAVFGIVNSTIITVISALGVLAILLSLRISDEDMIKLSHTYNHPLNRTEDGIKFGLILFSSVVHLLLSCCLLVGAEQKLVEILKLWRKVNFVLLVMLVLTLALQPIYYDGNFNGINCGTIVLTIFEVIFQTYEIWVVSAFIDEIQSSRNSRSQNYLQRPSLPTKTTPCAIHGNESSLV